MNMKIKVTETLLIMRGRPQHKTAFIQDSWNKRFFKPMDPPSVG